MWPDYPSCICGDRHFSQTAIDNWYCAGFLNAGFYNCLDPQEGKRQMLKLSFVTIVEAEERYQAYLYGQEDRKGSDAAKLF